MRIKNLNRIYSVILGFCFFAFCSCAPSFEPQLGVSQAQLIATHYGGTAQGPEINDYLIELEQKLLMHMPKSQNERFQIVLLNSEVPLAASVERGSILISRGLVFKVSNEAELAFVIAHEMAHQSMNHLSRDLSQLSETARKSLEEQADLQALGIVALAGYDPRAALGALSRVYYALDGSLAEGSLSTQNYPPIEERIYAAQERIYDSGWTPPGLISRRDFAVFRDAVIAQNVH